MVAMILAAGRGERLRPVTDRVPKALVEVAGETLIDRHLHMLAGAGISTVVINLGWLGEQIVAHIGSGSRYKLHVVYSPEYDQALETGGGIRRALPILGNGPFWVVNADILTDMVLPAEPLAENLLGELVLVPTPPHKQGGDFGLQDGKVVNVVAPTLTFSGVARYRADFFADAASGRFSIVPMLRQAADAGRLGGRLYEGRWEDVGTPERLARLNAR